ncbi:MAG: sigma-54 dependent transcriptional regulator [Pseudomonadota bacterium]|nr:sigma-54 dependent transcriptional regulator [Pseudomonadota bacterium]
MSAQDHTILLVDDDQHIATLFKAILEDYGYAVLVARDGHEALDCLERCQVHCVVTDLTMPKLDGFGLMEAIREKYADLPIIVVTGEGKGDAIDRALHLDTENFLTKPVSTEELRFAVQRALHHAELQQRKPAPTKEPPKVREPAMPYVDPLPDPKPASGESKVVIEFPDLVGRSPAMVRIKEMIAHVADRNSNVLILGESGVGKEVIARALHNGSSRRHKLFVPVNCGAIPEELMESELFGHEKGAFTGAITSRKGRFELAEGGTLFLDEIGEMSLRMQVKLLRVLQERTFERVGSNRTLNADVRIIAATHRNLEQAIDDGSFREDLYYRLNVFPMEVPPLRERREDIPMLMQRFLAKHRRAGREVVEFTDAAVAALMANDWRGNVRELENLLQRLIILYPNRTVDVADLPEKYQPEDCAAVPLWSGSAAQPLPDDGMDLKQHLHDIEYNLIVQALERCDHVVAHAAEQLGIRRTTLVEKLRKFGLDKRAAES